MKFSVLLPTRNRLDLLARAIESVRRQDYDDWEVVVSDNDSDQGAGQDILGYVASLGDERIRAVRTDAFIPVTDNWNNALAHSTGDWVVMLGDDDALMPGYFTAAKRLIEGDASPDVLVTSAYLFAYPGVMPGSPEGWVKAYDTATLFRDRDAPYVLPPDEARGLAEDSLQFRARFDYNMQFFLISRAVIDSLAAYGPFFQSPYPDYYAANALMLKARRILVVPEPMAVIGISPKSFGFYYFNSNEAQGDEFLRNLPDPAAADRLREVLLPGTTMNNSWLFAMEALRQNFGEEFGLEVDVERYRYLQIAATYAALIRGDAGADEAEGMRAALTPEERTQYADPLAAQAAQDARLDEEARVKAAADLLVATGSHQVGSTSLVAVGGFATILDLTGSGIRPGQRLVQEADGDAEVQRLREELAALKASTSWRITAPLRRVGGWLRRSR